MLQARHTVKPIRHGAGLLYITVTVARMVSSVDGVERRLFAGRCRWYVNGSEDPLLYKF